MEAWAASAVHKATGADLEVVEAEEDMEEEEEVVVVVGEDVGEEEGGSSRDQDEVWILLRMMGGGRAFLAFHVQLDTKRNYLREMISHRNYVME